MEIKEKSKRLQAEKARGLCDQRRSSTHTVFLSQQDQEEGSPIVHFAQKEAWISV